jgi:serine/threonine protein kinase
MENRPEDSCDICDGKYIIKEPIGRGKFGWVYRGIRKKTGELIAIKVESCQNSMKILKHEATVLHFLQTNGCLGIPTIHWFGNADAKMCMVMTLYESSLYDIVKDRGIKPEVLYSVYRSLIDITESVHSKFVIHRDIKPHNFMYKGGQLFIIDFGMANFYVQGENQHIEPAIEQTMNIIGTPNYISPNIHNGMTPSRRDDLISLGYVFLFLLKGSLPWENARAELDDFPEIHIGHSRNLLRLEKKSLENLQAILLENCAPLYQYLKYTYRIEFRETPHYSAMKNMFVQNNIK